MREQSLLPGEPEVCKKCCQTRHLQPYFFDTNDYFEEEFSCMAQRIPDKLHIALEDELKVLGTDELLDCWEQSQFLEVFMEGDPLDVTRSNAYERVIIQELQLRKCQATHNYSIS